MQDVSKFFKCNFNNCVFKDCTSVFLVQYDLKEIIDNLYEPYVLKWDIFSWTIRLIWNFLFDNG
jgi:hypothetical protein